MSIKNLGKTIREARNIKGLSLRQLGDMTGITYSYIGALENGKYTPSPEKIASLAKVLGLDPDILLLMAGHAPINYAPITEPEMIRLPIVKEAGVRQDPFGDQQIIDYETIPKAWVNDGEYFILIVSGESMIDDGIKEGHKAWIKRQDFVENGKIGLVTTDEEEGILRRIYYQDGMIILQPANSKIPPIILKPEEVIIHGQVTKVEFDV